MIIIVNTKDFLKKLHGSDAINFRLIKEGVIKNLKEVYEEETICKLKKHNEEYFNVYFVVNGGGTKKAEINKINAVFCDFDAGKDVNKQYYPLDVTKEYKRKCIEKVNQFQHKPSFIVETRNGIHVYWLVDEDATIEEFEECQKRLMYYFDSDKAIKSPERIMRLPGYNWAKDVDNVYMCSVLECNDVRYDIKSIIDKLPKIEKGEDIGATKRDNNNISVSLSRPPKDLSDNISHLRMESIEQLQAVINPEHVILSTYEEVYEYLKKQDLQLFLGLPRVFNCIFHEDNNPSANIYQDYKTGYYWYKCFSESCGVVKDIISITENLLNCNTPYALNFLRRVYKIDFVETEWQKQKKEVLDCNIVLLLDIERFKNIAPETYSRIRYYIPDLIVIMNFARNKIYTENFTDSKGLPLFYASLGYLQELCGCHSRKRINKIITLLTYLGLINKLDESEIPEFLFKESKYKAVLKKQRKIISYFSFPSYCDEILTSVENKAKKFKLNGLSMKGLSREMILRTLGEEEANRMYPQLKGRPLTQKSEEFAFEVEKVLSELIILQGYATETQITDCFKGSKDVNRTRLKRVISEIMEKYDFVKVKMNKKLKESLSIEGTGYPFIIIESGKLEQYLSPKKPVSSDILRNLVIAKTFDREVI